ncbi:MAG: HNH endonuclease [Bacilli bacterium]|nr:HNH endonuclease [Bacilli bacterium]
MSKSKVLKLWKQFFGDAEVVVDYAGRIIKRSACGDPNSDFHPTIDHINPVSNGGQNILGNLIICHRDTNAEKGYRFPHWKANGRSFKAIHVPGNPGCYTIKEGV